MREMVDAVATLRTATAAEVADWDALVQANPDGGQWAQGEAYGALKQHEDGLHLVHLVLKGAPGVDGAVAMLALEHRSIVGRQWYLPQGPSLPIEAVPAFTTALRAFAQTVPHLYAVRIEPFVVDEPEVRSTLADAGWLASDRMQQNQHTVLVDLEPETDAIFAAFSKNLRNHIRKAGREGYRVEKVEPTDENLETMYRLMQTVSGGKGVAGMKPFRYYRRLWTELRDRGQGHLWFGYDGAHEGPQASSFMIGYGRYALAKDGGSVPDRAIRGGAHLMRWTAMQWFKEHDGRTIYDAYATPPSWKADDRSEQLWGPGQFKLLFGPITDHVPSHLLLLEPRRWRLFSRVVLPIEWRVRRRPYGIW